MKAVFKNIKSVSLEVQELILDGDKTGPAAGGGPASATPQADAISSATTSP